MKKRIRSTAVVVHNDQILSFFAIDPTSGKEYFFLPGGGIESGESPIETAIRETFEETGYQIRIESSSAIDKEYFFHWDGQDYDCLTLFYRGYLTNPFQAPKELKDAEYNKGHRWVPMADVEKIFSYTPEILEAVLELSKI